MLYNVTEYYPNGKMRLVGKSKDIDYMRFDGVCLTFYKSGKRKSTATYAAGYRSGSFGEYYPNGKLYVHKEMISLCEQYAHKPSEEKILEAYDSLGTVKVKDGNGIYTKYNDDFTGIIEQGAVANGNKTGVWKGTDPKYNATFEEEYKDGQLVAGKAVVNGVNTSYTARIVSPAFPGGEYKYFQFLFKNIKYPVIDRQNNIKGRVILIFAVEKDGKISDVRISQAPSRGMGEEAARALQLCPKLIPGTAYGTPARIDFSMPVNFFLSTE